MLDPCIGGSREDFVPQTNADHLRDSLVLAIHSAEFMCRVEHGCKSAVDCSKCELLNKDCTKGYIVNRLLKQFDIYPKDSDNE